MKKIIYTVCTLSVVILFTACKTKPASEDKEKMHANAKRMSDSIQKVVDDGLNSVPDPGPAKVSMPASDTTKK